MPNTNYFRRPTLAGNTLVRTQNATLRGSVRRTDADGFSGVPYFPGLTGKTLQIKIESTTYNVAFTTDSFSDALSAINAVIDGHPIGVANGDAFDTDGSITIRSTSVSGGGSPLKATGSVEIVGGTAAAILGFDITYHALKAYGGETLGAPEGRLGNPFRTSFMTRGENLTVDSVNRSLAALSANADVLYSHHNREDAVLQKVNTFTNNGFYITVGAGISVPIGLGFLTNSSSKEDLAPFFQIIDLQTKQPHASRVVGVVKGPPGAVYPTGWPYTNQTVWTDNLGRNLLGQQIEKTPGGAAISSIVEGKYVACAGSPFTHVVAGDFVEVYGATNTDHLDNNGFKWVVEEVVSSSIIALRPMSKSELDLVGYTPTTTQPSVELASTKQPSQSFGAVMVKTGAFATVPASQPDSLNLVVFPEIPAGASIELWMAQPKNLMDVGPYDIQKASGYGLRQVVSDYDPAPNGLLSSPSVSFAGPTLNVGSFYVRWHGRVIRVGATAITAPANPFCESVVYWDEDTNSVKLFISSTTVSVYNPTTIFSGDANPSASTAGAGFQIATATSSSGSWASVTSVSRLENGKKATVTVGHGGDFASLSEVALFLYSMRNATTESATANGAYPHFDIVLLSDQTLTANVAFLVPSVTIRGASKAIRLISNQALAQPVIYTEGSLSLENLTVKMLTNPQTLVQASATGASRVIIRNVTQDLTGGGLPTMKVVRTSSAAATDVLIEDCNFSSILYIIENVGAGTGDLSISRSTVSYQFQAPYIAPMFLTGDAKTLRISQSSFPSWSGGGSGIVFSDLASPSLTDVSMHDSRFDFGAQTDVASVFIRATGVRCLISGCYINMTGNAGINKDPGSATIIRDCTITTNAFGVGGAMNALRFLSNEVVLAVDSVSNTNQYLIDSATEVSGNRFTGIQAAYYVRINEGGVVSDNYFNLGPSSWLPQTQAVLDVQGDGLASGNYIEGTGGCVNAINIASGRASVVGNWVFTGSGCGIYIQTGGSVVQGNFVEGPAEPINGTANNGNIITNNKFVSTVLPGGLPFGGEFFGNIYDIGSLSFSRSSVNRELLIRDCTFTGNFTFSASNQHFHGCRFVGTTVITGRLDSQPQQVSQVHFKGPTSLFGCQADNCVFENTGVTAIGVGSIFLTGCTVTNSSFLVFDSTKDIVRMRNCILDTCRSSILITDHLSIASDYNYVYNTTCKNSNYITGIYLSERTKVGVLDGCDIDNFFGDESTIAGPRDLTITNSSIMSVFVKRCGVVRVENSVIGRRVPGTFTSANSPNFRFEFDPWANAGSALTGTLTFTNGSATVTGVGTQFLKEIQVGDLIRPSASANTDLAMVTAIASATSLTISAVWGPATASGVSGIAGRVRADIVGNSVNHNPGFNGFYLDGELAGFGAHFNVSHNRMQRPGEFTFVNTQLNVGSPSRPLESNLTYVGNTVFGFGYNCLIDSETAVQLSISNNVFDDYGNGMVIDTVTSGTYSGAVTNNLMGYFGITKGRGVSITGNRFKGPYHPVVRIWDSTDVVFDGNYVYLTVPAASDRVMTLGITTRWRLTNNIIGKAFLGGTSTNNIMDFQSGPDFGFIGGNHFFSVGAGPPAAPSCSTAVGANTKWLLDAAVGVGPPANFGGTQSGSTS